jgi:hypothetical protein
MNCLRIAFLKNCDLKIQKTAFQIAGNGFFFFFFFKTHNFKSYLASLKAKLHF